MRLKPYEIAAIKAAANDVFGPGVVVRLFGSRVRDDLRGGDIDLLIEVDQGQDNFHNQDRFKSTLFKSIEEQKVDVVFYPRGGEPSAFARMVAPESVALP